MYSSSWRRLLTASCRLSLISFAAVRPYRKPRRQWLAIIVNKPASSDRAPWEDIDPSEILRVQGSAYALTASAHDESILL